MTKEATDREHSSSWRSGGARACAAGVTTQRGEGITRAWDARRERAGAGRGPRACEARRAVERGASEEDPTNGATTKGSGLGVARGTRVGSRAQGTLSKGARSRVPGYSWLGSGGE